MNRLSHIDPQRRFAIALIVLQAVALAVFCQAWIVTTVVMSLTLLAIATNARWLPLVVSSRFPLIFPLAYVLHKTILPSTFTTSGDSLLIPDASLIATYFLFYQLALLFAIYEDDRLPNSLPILAITGLIFAGDIRINDSGRFGFQVAALLLVVFSICFYLKTPQPSSTATRFTRGHRRWLWGLGVACCAVSWISSFGLYRYSREIESALSTVAYPRLRPSVVGFSGNGRIGSVAQQKGNQGKSVAVRVFSDNSPGYLRGKVFDTYSGGQWQRQSQTSPFVPSQGVDVDQTEPLEIWPAQSFREVLFTPLGVTKVEAPADQLLVDSHGVISGEELQSMTPYTAWRPRMEHNLVMPPSTPPTDAMERLLSLPKEMGPKIQELAKEIVGEAVVTEDKIAAVENFFADHFQYHFGIDVPSGEDPIEYFLLNRPPAHCEFFASGAVMLLRSVGVPCRYATGFVAVEPNKVGNFWVARNRDAHAWVEAYDPQFGWVIVEPTLASGVPQSNESNRVDQVIDAARSWWQQLLASIRSGRAKEILISWFVWLLLPISVLAIPATAVLAWRRFHRKRSSRIETLDPQTQRLQSLLQQMDDLWRRDGLPRSPHETLEQFARRLQTTDSETNSGINSSTRKEQAAVWYRRFATARYSGQLNEEVVEQLTQSQRRVCQAESP